VSAAANWTPRLLLTLRTYTRQDFVSDLIAGVTVGLVALPLAMAFGIASGVTPQAGIYTAVIAGFLISALGGSSLQIGGPTGAFVVIVAGIIAKFGFSGLLIRIYFYHNCQRKMNAALMKYWINRHPCRLTSQNGIKVANRTTAKKTFIRRETAGWAKCSLGV